MECNKDEAIHSCKLAEQKFLLHDLMGAKKFALKAQHLFPGLEGLPQLLAVLDVHIIAQDKVDGVDPDWYRILQTHAAADEATIRKQYRKLALNLHPDKNKAVGAEGAFMLISEAWGVLSDKAKKAAHDARRRQKGRPADGFCNFTSFNTKKWPQPKSGRKASSMWIKCPFCQVQVHCVSALEPNVVVCSVCHQAFAESETCRTNMNPFYQGKEYFKSKGKLNVVSKAEDQGHGATNLVSTHSPPACNTMSFGCEPEDPSRGTFTSSYHGPEEVKYTYARSARHDKGDVRAARDVSQQQSDQLAAGVRAPLQNQEGSKVSDSCVQASTGCHPNFQSQRGSHRTRSSLNCSPADIKATAEMVQNVFESVRRERVRAQREVREKVMKERLEAEKEARRQEVRERREQKQRRRDEDLKKQAKAALHAKKAFDKLFARDQRSSKEDISIISRASFECKNDAHETGVLNADHEADHFNSKSLEDLTDCQDVNWL